MRRSTLGSKHLPIGKKATSPVARVRTIKPLIRLLLFVRAGGRCEFDGHNKYLLRHSYTLTEGNFAHIAHIVAFSRSGPRGKQKMTAKEINDAGNLMLLCPDCHKLIDTNPEKYSVKTLRKFKQVHEARISRLTSTRPDRHTTVVVMKSNIGDQAVDISFAQIQEAIAPRYPDAEPISIDLTDIPDSDDAIFRENAKRAIDHHITRLYDVRFDSPRVNHISVFALGPIPLLAYLGSRLSSKIPLELFQRHRDTKNWTWKTADKHVNYQIKLIQVGTDLSKVALVLSLSGSIRRNTLPPHINADFYIYEISLKGVTPDPMHLRTKQDLLNFQRIYQRTLGKFMKDHPALHEFHLFPAVPAPVAVMCGYELLPKSHPTALIYDNDKKKGGFTFAERIN